MAMATSRAVGTTNLIMSSLVVAGIIATITFYGSLVSVVTFVVTVCALITWPILILFDRSAARKAPKVLSPAELARYKRARAIVFVGLIAIIVLAVLYNR
jgi:uncharacterized membrane protein YkgB